ncbi:hypothetical protein HRG_013774 [Hirsutella rhossiliensis]
MINCLRLALEWLRLAWSHSTTFVLLWLLYAALLALYRLTLHPLAKFPGPMMTKTSYFYEFWFDVILRGRYTREIARLHEIYGPIVRINPDELHCNDPKFVDIIYAFGHKRRDKASHFLAGFPARYVICPRSPVPNSTSKKFGLLLGFFFYS